ncbi:autotransporter outer membrane beta-barrel domain-containing protein [Pseudomonas sp. 5P_3.1_Bac2]|uniref:autotransporter outer membrane beta-barrel domain-containing protein n=1 Tax=Pseudomonas sp. 5P_3.1_Bac2 TaxID=2971617 RepID=UPI0021C701E0|nr:autotransporter outer membrane beta-barrel domain-containing protein [Pseudomonas sp. 5P_3.1_Bac2]MCU1719009.1 autotransporter outer membrane beta-barrel domain-containing protein [Pseudomonas sp. 5P_3.1_Bac2]
MTLDGANVNTTGTESSGVNATTNTTATIKNSTITASQAGSIGVNATANGTDQTHVSISDSSVTAERAINTTTNGTIELSNVQATGKAQGGTGQYDGGIGATLTGGEVIASQGSSLTGDKNGALLKTDIPSSGREVSPTLTLDNSSATGLTGSAIVIDTFELAPGEGPITSEANVFINNGSTLSAGNGVLMEVTDGAIGNFTVDNSALTGDMLVSADSTGRLTLQNSASLTGQLTGVDSLSVNSNATWFMVDSASVGSVSMSGGTIAVSSGGGFNTLTMDSLSGSGTFALNTDLAMEQGDLISVTGEASGNHQLAIKNTGAEPASEDGSLQVIHTGSGDASFSVIGGVVDLGTYQYELQQQGNDWYLTQQANGGGGGITPSTSAVLGLFNAAPSVWYGELSSLRTRLGELRTGSSEGGLWMRSYGNRYKLSAAANLAYQQDQQGISFGADLPLESSTGNWLVGAMVGYSKSDLDIHEGTSGEVDSYYVGLYNTYMADNGWYFDGSVKFNRFKNDADVRMSDGTKAKGDYNNNGVGGSFEFGRTFNYTSGWFVEPFAQYSMLWVDGDDYSLDNGMRADSNHANSRLLKAGSTFGKNFHTGASNYTTQLYVRLAAAHEFVQNNDVQVNDDTFTNDMSGSRFEVTTGGSISLSERLQAHANFDYSNGENIEQPFGVNLGLRYLW